MTIGTTPSELNLRLSELLKSVEELMEMAHKLGIDCDLERVKQYCADHSAKHHPNN